MNKLINVLLVEDSEADQFLFEAAVEEVGEGVLVTKASDGEEAHNILVSQEVLPRFIFLDINMPRMNGYEFLASSESILEQENISVYMLTSSSREHDKEQAMAYSCVKGYIEKPCPVDSLESILMSTRQQH
jgi:CheY-like chemotaxis protein